MAFILIVDADERHSRRVSEALTADGHTCGWADGAEKARAVLPWRRPDLVLMAAEVGGAWQPDAPVIMLTSSADAPGNSMAHGAADATVRKPVDPEYLVWRANHSISATAGGCVTGSA